MALGVFGNPAHKAAGPIGVSVGAGRLRCEMLTEINQGGRHKHTGFRVQSPLVARHGVGFRLRFPFQVHGGFAGLGQIVGSGFAVVGLLSGTLEHA